MSAGVLMPGEWAQQIEKHGCHYMQLNHVCKKTGKACLEWCHGEACDEFINRGEVVRFKTLDKNLQALISEANGNMLFVEIDDTRFNDEELDAMMDDVILHYPQLAPYVQIDKSRTGDALITIYQGIGKVLEKEEVK